MQWRPDDSRRDEAVPEADATYYDRQEVRNPAERELALLHALPGLIRHARENAPFFAERLRGLDPDAVTDRPALARLPVVRKADLSALQQARLPFGGLNATPVARLARIYASPGPIYDPEGPRNDYWRFARAMYAAGFRAGELVYNTFSYHLTPGGAMAEAGARALGCPVIPGGTGQTELQVRAIADLRPTAYVGTPSFLLTLLQRSDELKRSPVSLTKALVSGEAFPPATRQRLTREFGIEAHQCYATADLGLIAYESRGGEGLILDEAVLVEIVRPGTDVPVAEGEVGEVVVTVFNPDYPLIRFGTGDLSAILPGESPCGRTNARIRGWLGRADQTTKVRGMFVHPRQLDEALRGFETVRRARLVVARDASGQDLMQLRCEVAETSGDLGPALARSVRAATGLWPEIELVPPGTLPNDGKVIDDRRAHS